MSRQVRSVPPSWQHPTTDSGDYIPLLGQSFVDAWCDYECGDREDCPNPDDFMPEFPLDTATHLMMYETSTEGTPISPAFETPSELIDWLVSNHIKIYAGTVGKRADWEAIIDGARPVLSLDNARAELGSSSAGLWPKIDMGLM